MTKMFDGEKWVPAKVAFRVYTREIWVEYTNGEADCEWFFETHEKRAKNYFNKLCANPPKNATCIRYTHHGQIVEYYKVV